MKKAPRRRYRSRQTIVDGIQARFDEIVLMLREQREALDESNKSIAEALARLRKMPTREDEPLSTL
jgi:hypothetical protein